jgi:hypothetical protein
MDRVQSVHRHPRIANAHCCESRQVRLPKITETCDFISISQMRRIWQLMRQKGTEYMRYVYILAPPAFRGKARATKYHEANNPETEIWRARQRSSTAVDGGGLLLAAE